MDKKIQRTAMKKLIIFILLSALPCIAQAEHYQWVENGIHHFSNCRKPPGQRGVYLLTEKPPPPPMPTAKEKEAEINETIEKIEARNEKVETLKQTYLKPGMDAVNKMMKLISPESP